MTKRFTISFLLLLQTVTVWGQDSLATQSTARRRPNPYQLSWKIDGSMAGLIAVTGASSLILEQQVQPFTLNDLSRFDRSQVNAFDRGATYNWSERAYQLSDKTLTANFVATGLIVLTPSPVTRR